MTMHRTLATVVGPLLALAFLAAPPTRTYGQVDERTQPRVEQQDGQQSSGQPTQGKPALTQRQKSLLSEISSAIHTVAASAEQSIVHIEVTEGREPRTPAGMPGGRGRTPGRTPPRNQDQDQDQDEDQDQAPTPTPRQGSGRGQGQLPPELQDQLRRFFGGQVPRFFEQEPAEPTPRRGLGSGIIYDNKGHILTNNHVVGGATKIRVLTTNGRSLSAEVVGTDPLTDVAVIKVKGDSLPPVEFGDSSKVEVGDLVLAMGNPFGLDYSVTLGIISARGRSGLQLGSIYYQDFLQTDAAINPGNSGGPLVNMDGQVIGMSTAIATQTGQYAGVGFAIPSNMARRIADILIAKGKVTRGWLGVSIKELKPAMAESFGFPADRQGVLVEDVKPDSPAAEAGFQAGDIIVMMDGKPVRNPTQLQTAVTLSQPNQKVNFEVWRNGKTVKLTAELGELKESYLRAMEGEEDEGQGQPGSSKRYKSEELGITYVTATADVAKQYEWTRTPKGSLVVEVNPAGEAANLMIRPGDVIESVNNQAIASAKDLQDALKKVSGEDGEGFRMYVRGPRMGGRYVWVQRQ